MAQEFIVEELVRGAVVTGEQNYILCRVRLCMRYQIEAKSKLNILSNLSINQINPKNRSLSGCHDWQKKSDFLFLDEICYNLYAKYEFKLNKVVWATERCVFKDLLI